MGVERGDSGATGDVARRLLSHGVMKRCVFLAALFILCSCGDSEEESAASVSTTLSVEVFLGEPGRSWNVEVFEVLDTGELQVVERAESDSGAFEIDLGFRSGIFYVRASSDGQEQLSAYTRAQLDQDERLFITPYTHLAAVLADFLEGPPDQRIERAESLVNSHFLGLSHAEIRPFDVRREPAVSFTDDVASGFLLEALSTLAREWSEDRASGAVSAGRLLDSLAADLAEDGLFDGRGERGRMIVLGGRGLDSMVLRSDLGRALLSFADSSDNVTAFSREDLQSAAQALAESRSPLFPDGETEPLDDDGPVFTRWFFSRGGVPIPADRPLRGIVDLEVELEDAGQVVRVAFPAAGVEVTDRTAVRFPFDTTVVGEGPQTAELVAADDSGNESRLSVAFDVDNTAPTLTVAAIGRVTGTTVAVSGSAMDDRGPVTEIRALVGSEEVGRAEDVAGPFSFGVEIPCGQRFSVVVQAIDRAGNVAEVPEEVLCDVVAPAIEVVLTTFVQEDSLEAVHSDDGAVTEYRPGPNGVEQAFIDAFTVWPIRISKYINRLDDLSAVGVVGGGSNIPRIRFRATELAGQPVASGWEALTVEYRYLVDGTEIRPWTVLSPIGGLPEYEVPMSYQALGPELGSAGPPSEHVVEVRVTDEVGLTATRAFPFGMDLLSPPVLFSGCQLSPVLSSFQIPAQNMGALYGSLPEAEAVIGDVAYPLHLPPGSLAPPISARLAFTAPSAETRVLELWEDTHFATANHPDSNDTMGCPPNNYALREMPLGRNVTCTIGDVFLDRSLERNTFGLNDGDSHTTRVELRRGASVLQPDANGQHEIGPDSPADVRGMLVAPRVRFDGVAYNWRQSFSLPNGYMAGPYGPRYRLDWTWHEGVDLAPWNSWVEPDVAFVTRPYMYELELELSPMALSAQVAGRTDIALDVQVEPECELSFLHQTTAH